MTNYPEHDKLKAVQRQSQIIGEFLDWLLSQGYSIEFEGMEIGELSFSGLLAEFFEIDLKKIETEKRQMLTEIRLHAEKDTSEELNKAIDDGTAVWETDIRPTFVDLMVLSEAQASVALDNDEVGTFSVEEMPSHGDKGE